MGHTNTLCAQNSDVLDLYLVVGLHILNTRFQMAYLFTVLITVI
jgi:hypothetical protein